MNVGVTPSTAVVIEDDEIVRELLVDILDGAGLHTIAVDNGADGVRAVVEHNPLITTVDINMPGIDGLEATRRIRARSSTHIIVVSALTDEADAVLALSAGADDFVAKPFRAREFRARIDSVLRRVRETEAPSASAARTEDDADAVLQHHDLVVDRSTRVVRRAGVEVGLTRTEFDILVALLQTGRRVRAKSDLVMVVRGDRQDAAPITDVDLRTMETHIANLRRKLAEDSLAPRYIETVRGVGYRLTEVDSA
ncbi:response regulator transcription factor [Microbacterium flavescens]|uniref:response regulator transcription factor n=1 Tax=Microbacterium flavescens TaxID=69366 RepID=UPI001BDE98FA|nr:response regulator transcription factor [Microbacterium flavescens]BFF09891.1 response regulator transcription factor [Microbacterium flavescens]